MRRFTLHGSFTTRDFCHGHPVSDRGNADGILAGLYKRQFLSIVSGE